MNQPQAILDYLRQRLPGYPFNLELDAFGVRRMTAFESIPSSARLGQNSVVSDTVKRAKRFPTNTRSSTTCAVPASPRLQCTESAVPGFRRG